MEHISHPPQTAPASSTQRLLTAAVGTPIIVAGILLLSGPWFFLFVAIIFTGAALEYVGIVRPRAPHAPLAVLVVLVPLAALVMTLSLDPAREQLLLLALGALTSVGIGSMVLLARTPLDETLESLGILAFGLPYFAVPLASIYRLQQRDRGLIFLLLAIVWLGDTAAFYVGSRFGRHKMAPTISPKKTWDGAAAGFLTGVAAAAAWSLWWRGGLEPELLVLGAFTAAAAQVGDLVESMLKRGADVKDSGKLLPGHGGMLDRIDSILFCAPILYYYSRLFLSTF